MKPHKLCKLFPAITGQPLADLIKDIKANGLRQPITTYEGQILDGANRYAACQAAGVEPQTVEFTGADPLAFVISQNMNRRHLTESQRAAIAAEIATSKHGGSLPKTQGANLPLEPVTNATAAAQMKVSERSVKTARKLKQESPALHRKVKEGKISLHAATESLKPEKPAALKGIDVSKLNPPEPHDPSDPAYAEPEPERERKPTDTVLVLPLRPTKAQFRSHIDKLKIIVDVICDGNQKLREEYAAEANLLVRHLVNQPEPKHYSAYTR